MNYFDLNGSYNKHTRKKQFNHAYADGIEGLLSNSIQGNIWKSKLIIYEYLSINLQTLKIIKNFIIYQ
ncbi:MAG: hypothetical protein F6K40_02995 [Okeania sp. SIO3I5]|uniref:hypothetical protein n=1 Tax=Okeania sp. SIO3I5 TaxID=2607805 RepID=UPI0013BA03B6|nr:hypothetical protein [Okeania sp. SIO3I5]NEQ35329.1 hypothetical protein [Okeania sp. SIO3I5]